MTKEPANSSALKNPSKWIVIIFLIMAGEMIFGLPFHVVRYFRPTFLEVFNLSNAALGDAMAIYGITAMISYFPGGVIADRFSARKLMSLSLIATGAGGLYLATIPGPTGLAILFGFWGMTTILLFWSAMIRATREWGGKFAQGRAFGFLDGGRGLLAAGVATLAVFILSAFLPNNLSVIAPDERSKALTMVIYFYSGMTAVTAVLVWFFIPDSKTREAKSHVFSGIGSVLRNRSAWLQALIVVCAYCGYRGLDFYALYGIDVLGMNEVSAARFVSNAAYLRPIGAIGAGFLADWLSTKKVLKGTFLILTVGYLALIFLMPGPKLNTIIVVNLIFTFLAVYALRGVYFALFEEMNISAKLTGRTVGLVSMIGFTPDIFFNSIGGRILDASPGITGYHNYFLFLGVFSVLGFAATYVLSKLKPM